MADVTRLVRTNYIPSNGPGGAPIVYRKDSKRIAYKDGNQAVRFIGGTGVDVLTAAYTATKEDDGKTFLAGAVASVVVTLPSSDADTEGMELTLALTGLASSGAGHAFSPQAADSIIGNGFTEAANKDAICSAASDRVGDSITLQSLGNGQWLITSVTGTWAREA